MDELKYRACIDAIVNRRGGVSGSFCATYARMVVVKCSLKLLQVEGLLIVGDTMKSNLVTPVRLGSGLSS